MIADNYVETQLSNGVPAPSGKSEKGPTPSRLLVCGMRGAGKSHAINILLRQREAPLRHEFTVSMKDIVQQSNFSCITGHYLGHPSHFPVECIETIGFNGGKKGDARAMEAIEQVLNDGIDHVLLVMSVVSRCNQPERRFLRKIVQALRTVQERVTLVISKADSPELFKTAQSRMGPYLAEYLRTKHNFEMSTPPLVLSSVLIENPKYSKYMLERLVALGAQSRNTALLQGTLPNRSEQEDVPSLMADDSESKSQLSKQEWSAPMQISSTEPSQISSSFLQAKHSMDDSEDSHRAKRARASSSSANSVQSTVEGPSSSASSSYSSTTGIIDSMASEWSPVASSLSTTMASPSSFSPAASSSSMQATPSGVGFMGQQPMLLQRLPDGRVQLQPATSTASDPAPGSIMMHLRCLGDRLSGSMDTAEYTHHLDDMRMADGPNGLPMLTGRLIRRHRVTGEMTLMEAAYSYSKDRKINGQLQALDRLAPRSSEMKFPQTS